MILELDSVSARLGGRVVLTEISFAVDGGEFVGLVGPNGSGKSTLLRCIAGALPSAGKITVAGRTQSQFPDDAKKSVGYCMDPKSLPSELTGRQCLELIAGARGTTLDATAALTASLKFSPWLDRYVGEYSFGTRQKLAILIALVGDPPLLLLDESLNGLDPVSRLAVKDELVRLIRTCGRSLIIATHGIDADADLFDRLVLLNEGRCVRVWDRSGLNALRSEGSLERSLVRHLTEGN